MKELFQILIALWTGTVVGAIFSLLKLPLPSPTARAGVAGIAGMLIGSLIVNYFLKK